MIMRCVLGTAYGNYISTADGGILRFDDSQSELRGKGWWLVKSSARSKWVVVKAIPVTRRALLSDSTKAQYATID